MYKALSVVLCLYLALGLVQAHSWLQCSDYAEENGRMWDATKCRGWPIYYESAFQYNNIWGGDVGYNYQPSGGVACQNKGGARSTTKYPSATYSAGQRVCLAWPPKNHVAANCDNPNIGDAGTKIYRSAINPTADPTLDQFHQNLVHDFGGKVGTTGNGFQNCPNFCADKDKSLCTGCFEIPQNLPQGKYTFLWEWAFNSAGDLYTNCFDVDIVADSGKYITSTYKKVSADEYKALLASGTADTPTTNGPPAKPSNNQNGGTGNNQDNQDNQEVIDNTVEVKSGGISPAAAGVIVVFVIMIVGAIAGAVVFVKIGNGTINSKFPFFHTKSRQYETRTGANYVAFADN